MRSVLHYRGMIILLLLYSLPHHWRVVIDVGYLDNHSSSGVYIRIRGDMTGDHHIIALPFFVVN